MNTCDDCRVDYPGVPYYTFETTSCQTMDIVNGVEVAVDHPCTGSICPECAGPWITPDDENDPRKPPIDFYDERLHQELLDAAHYAKFGDQVPVA